MKTSGAKKESGAGQRAAMAGALPRLLLAGAGLGCYALALNLFLVGNGIAAGGFAGLATLLNVFVPVPVGLVMLCLNLPLLAASWRIKGPGFTGAALAASFLYSALVDRTAAWLPLLTRSRPLAAAGGGLLYGVGLACLVRADLSVGGTDLLERLLLARHPAVSIGRISLLVDGAMVLLSVAVYRSFWMGLYALAAIVLCSLTADGLLALARRAAAPGRP